MCRLVGVCSNAYVLALWAGQSDAELVVCIDPVLAQEKENLIRAKTVLGGM